MEKVAGIQKGKENFQKVIEKVPFTFYAMSDDVTGLTSSMGELSAHCLWLMLIKMNFMQQVRVIPEQQSMTDHDDDGQRQYHKIFSPITEIVVCHVKASMIAVHLAHTTAELMLI